MEISIFELKKIAKMLREAIQKKKSTLVQIMNEVDGLTDDEKRFVLYWLKAKKNGRYASDADLTVKPNNITLMDIYKELNAARKQKT